MKKILKLINDERKLISIKGQKACSLGATDICTYIDKSDCRGPIGYDTCDYDYKNCKYNTEDYCKIDGDPY